MRIYYANAFFNPSRSDGGNAHIYQAIKNLAELGHDVWTFPGDAHPAANRLPKRLWDRISLLRTIDVVYIRIERRPPPSARLGVFPYRQILASPLIVWELNAAPFLENDQTVNVTKAEENSRMFLRYGKGCDLAICVSKKLAEYVQMAFHLPNVVAIPNGSDPALFRPDVPPVPRVSQLPYRLNVVWIGSADIVWHHFEMLANAARHIWHSGKGDEIGFHIIGSGFGDMGELPPNVHYYGAEQYSRLPQWLAAMDVGLVLYKHGASDYGSPLKLYDYLAAGLVVVSTDQPQVAQVLRELGQADNLVADGDDTQLASILISLAGNLHRVRCLGAAGRRLVEEKYNWRRTAVDTVKAIEDLQCRK
jgi:glycosyltransferase involved in cell wall biosynthesis